MENIVMDITGNSSMQGSSIKYGFFKEELQANKKTAKICKDNKLLTRTCECKKAFQTYSGYYKHSRKCNVFLASEKKIQPGNYVCKEVSCSFNSMYNSDFIKHLSVNHGLKFKLEERKFDRYSDFKEWKEEFEKDTSSFFTVSKRSIKQFRTIEHFKCNRSGHYTSKSTGLRLPKSQGLARIGLNCTAYMTVCRFVGSDKTVVNVCSTHYGHEKELLHLPIPKSIRKFIAEQVSKGSDDQDILKNIFSSAKTKLHQGHLCTKKDIKNISKAYGIKKTNIYNKCKPSLKTEEKQIPNFKSDKGSEGLLFENIQNLNEPLNVDIQMDVVIGNETNDKSQDCPISEHTIDQCDTNNLKDSILIEIKALCEKINSCSKRQLLVDAKEHIAMLQQALS